MSNIDISSTLVGNTDRLDAAALPEPRTIKIRSVKIGKNEKGRPNLIIHFEGDNGLPFIPCLSMRRVLAKCWGNNAASYIGRKITVYNDPDVTFGGQVTGGVRISHLSDIDGEIEVNLRRNRKQMSPFTVRPLKENDIPQDDCQNEKTPQEKATDWVNNTFLKKIQTCKTSQEVNDYVMQMNSFISRLEKDYPALSRKVNDAINSRTATLMQQEGK